MVVRRVITAGNNDVCLLVRFDSLAYLGSISSKSHLFAQRPKVSWCLCSPGIRPHCCPRCAAHQPAQGAHKSHVHQEDLASYCCPASNHTLPSLSELTNANPRTLAYDHRQACATYPILLAYGTGTHVPARRTRPVAQSPRSNSSAAATRSSRAARIAGVKRSSLAVLSASIAADSLSVSNIVVNGGTGHPPPEGSWTETRTTARNAAKPLKSSSHFACCISATAER